MRSWHPNKAEKAAHGGDRKSTDAKSSSLKANLMVMPNILPRLYQSGSAERPFELHTSYADKEKYYRNLRNPWLFLLLLFALFALIKHSLALGIFSLVSAIPSILYQIQIIVVRQKAKTWE